MNGVGACKCHPAEHAILHTARDELTLVRQLVRIAGFIGQIIA